MKPLWRDVADRLDAHASPTPDLDARLILQHVTERSQADVLTLSPTDLSHTQLERVEACVVRRAKGEPVSRIVGRRGFWNHDFVISPATLDPRPDSETLVELTLKVIQHEGWEKSPISILDLGTGSGCLLLSILDEMKHAKGVGIDISNEAINIAEANAENLGCADRTIFMVSDWFEAISGDFDIILSNPPYIPSTDIAGLMPDVKDYDPLSALDGGTDGLDAYRHIISHARPHLANGWLIFECGQGQAKAVTTLLSANDFNTNPPSLTQATDLAGILRCVAGRTNSSPERG